MEVNSEFVQVSVESSWTVLKGSLESCVSVVFLDPHTHEPIISSSPHSVTKLVLVPPVEPVPCEITVKFQGRLCHVQSLYTSSTARISEIYSQSNLGTDPEYICTVKGWIPCKESFSSDDGTEMNVEDLIAKRGDEVLVKGPDYSNESVHEGSMSSVVSPLTVSHNLGDDEYQKSVYSSGEDSWVNVKLNGSFSAESACVSLTAPDLDNWHVPLNVDALVHLEDQLVMASQGLEAEESIKLAEGPCEGKGPVEQSGQCNVCQEMFEAEVELVDHNPWASITIRLLSLQDKSVVEVDQMVFLAISGPVPEPIASSCQSDGRESNSALFGMFLPSILQMARGVSGNRKDLLKSEKSIHPCEQKQDMVDVLHAGNEDISKASNQCAVLEDMPVVENIVPQPPSVHNAADSAASKIDRSIKPEVEMNADGNALRRSIESGDQALQPGFNSNPMCNCKEFIGDVIAKDLATTFDAFSVRFDRLESLCLRMESFLHKTFESLDQRVTRLEEQHRKDSRETNSKSRHFRTLSDASILQSHRNNNQVYPSASLLYKSELKGEVSSALPESAVQDHLEMQYVVKEASNVNAVDCSLADMENLVKEAPCEIQELSSEPEVMIADKDSKHKEPRATLDDAWASALSAFASSFPLVVADTENTVASLIDEQSLGSSCNSGSVSRCFKELKEEENDSSLSSHSEVKFITVMTNDVDTEADNCDCVPIHGVCEEATCGEQTSITREGQGILLPSHFMTFKPVTTFDFLGVKEVRSSPDQKIPIGTENINSVDNLEGQDILQPSHSAAHEPDSMLFGETLDDWAAMMGLKNRSLPVFVSSSVENQDAAMKSPPHNICNTSGDYYQEKGNSSISGGDLQYDFFPETIALDAHAVWQRSFSSLNVESGNEKSEKESSCNASLELHFLSGHIMSEQGKGSASISEVQDPGSSKRSFTYSETEGTSNFLDLLENSSNYQDGRTCSQDSLCFSQDFDACPNDLCDNRWSCASNIFYLHDPELTDDEDDNTAGGLIETTEVSDSTSQGDFSDTDSTQELPFWPALHSVGKDEQPSIMVFPGFENLS